MNLKSMISFSGVNQLIDTKKACFSAGFKSYHLVTCSFKTVEALLSITSQMYTK